MPSYLWPMTLPPPVLAGYRLVMFRPYACFTSMYIQNLLAVHMFTVVWRLVYTFCCPSSASYSVSHFLASHSLKPAPFRAGFLLGCGLFLLQPTLLLFSTVLAFPVVPLCYSCCDVTWLNVAGPLLGLLFILLPMTLAQSLVLLLHYLQAPMSHLFLLGHPWPICSPWPFS